MAPRRSYGGGSSSSLSNSCSDNYAFEDTLSRVDVAFQGIFILIGALLFLYYVFTSRKSGARKSAPFYLYGLSLFFFVIVLVLGLVQLIFSQCDIGSLYSVTDIGITLTWVYFLAIMLLLATAMFTVCASLFNAVQSRIWLILKWINAVGFAVLAILHLVASGIYSYYARGSFTIRGQQGNWALLYLRIAVAVDLIGFVVVVLAGISLLLAWNAGRKAGGRKKGLLLWIVTFVIAFAIDWLIIFGQEAAELAVTTYIPEPPTSLALFIIRRFSELLTFIAVLAMARQAGGVIEAGTSIEKPYQYSPYTSNSAPEATHYQLPSTFPSSQQPQTRYAHNASPQPSVPQQHAYPRPPSPQQYSQTSQPLKNSYYTTHPSPRPAPEAVPLMNTQSPPQQSYQAYRPGINAAL